jgi:fatty acid desaturase
MATATPAAPALLLNSPALLRRVNGLRRLDNVTNWFYLVRECLLLASVVALTIAFYNVRADWGLAWAWNVPVTLVAIALIGACQHRLTTLGHEASHYMLFRSRKLNELTSDFLCMFPMWSTTHHYRLQHLAHHQFPNDPERDPDVQQLDASGHRYHWPMPPGRFVWECMLKQILLFPRLIRYVRMRAKFSATGEGSGPYEGKGPRSKVLVLAGLLYLVTQACTLTALVMLDQPLLLAVVPPVLLAAALVFYALVPNRLYRHSNLKPDVTPRVTTLCRMTYLTAVFAALAWLSYLTDQPWGFYYALLWIVPMATSFSFCMLMRQIVQHGNADGERFSNTRTFLVGSLIRWSVFPLGMDYHLPHHLFPLVPHYRLPQLHALLLETPEYREHGVVAEGYFFHRRPPEHPTVLELMAQQ